MYGIKTHKSTVISYISGHPLNIKPEFIRKKQRH